MKITNPNYRYGKSIIWNAYRGILKNAREECRRQQDIVMRLGRKLLELEEGSFEFALAVSIEEVFNSVPTEQRKLLYLRYCHGMTVKELASSYGITPSAVSHRITKARRLFQDLWKGCVYDD